MSKSKEEIAEYALEYAKAILQIDGEITKNDLVRAFQTGYLTCQLHMLLEDPDMMSEDDFLDSWQTASN